MRRWTEASFDAATDSGVPGADGIVWLGRRGDPKPARPGHMSVLDRIDRLGTEVGRLVLLIGCGCLASAAASNSAFAPVGSAHAAHAHLRLETLQASPPVETAAIPRQIAFMVPPIASPAPAPIVGLPDHGAQPSGDVAPAALAPATLDQALSPGSAAERREMEAFLRFSCRAASWARSCGPRMRRRWTRST